MKIPPEYKLKKLTNKASGNEISNNVNSAMKRKANVSDSNNSVIKNKKRKHSSW